MKSLIIAVTVLFSLHSFANGDSSPVSCRVHTKSSWKGTQSSKKSIGLELIEKKLEGPFGTSFVHKLDVDNRRYLVIAITGDHNQTMLKLAIAKMEGNEVGSRLASADAELVSDKTVNLQYGEDEGVDNGAEIFCKLK